MDKESQRPQSESQKGQQEKLDNPGQQVLIGTINQITKDKISVKTDEGKTRDFPINPVEQREIIVKGLKSGDRISLSFNQQNQVSEINKLDEIRRGGNEPKPLEPNQSIPTPPLTPPNPDPSPNPNQGFK